MVYIYHGISWYFVVYIMVYHGIWYNIRYILWYIDVYCHNAIRVTPKQTGSAAGSVIRSPGSVSTQGAFSCRPHAWGRDEALGSFTSWFELFRIHEFSFIDFHLFHNVSSMSAFSVGESGLKSSQDSNRLMSFVFFHPKFKLQEFLARRLFVCSKQQILRIFVAERLVEWEKTDGTG